MPNKASQRDQKTAASLWFFGPCLRRYRINTLKRFCPKMSEIDLLFFVLTNLSNKLNRHLFHISNRQYNINSYQSE